MVSRLTSPIVSIGKKSSTLQQKTNIGESTWWMTTRCSTLPHEWVVAANWTIVVAEVASVHASLVVVDNPHDSIIFCIGTLSTYLMHKCFKKFVSGQRMGKRTLEHIFCVGTLSTYSFCHFVVSTGGIHCMTARAWSLGLGWDEVGAELGLVHTYKGPRGKTKTWALLLL
jgi:hypothetical protein